MTGREPSFYAVNDRPVVLVPTADGGLDCLVADPRTGDLVPDRAYFARLEPGVGKDVDSLTEQEFGVLLRRWRTNVLRRMAMALCAVGSPSLDGLRAALPETQGPPPVGAVGVDVTGPPDHLVAYVRFELGPAAPTLGDLQATFGAGEPIVRIHWDSDHTLCFVVEVAGAPSRCSVFAAFRGAPQPATPARSVTLRVDPA